jgi:hypothetical protein
MHPNAPEPTYPLPVREAGPPAGEPLAPGLPPIPAIVQQSQAAFRRDLPDLLKTHYRQVVAYHGDRRLGFGRSTAQLLQEWSGRGIPKDEIVLFGVEPEPPEDDERVV